MAYIIGGDESSALDGTPGGDVIYGGGGDDTINGYAGDDSLLGGDGSDIINGGSGNDRIVGGGQSSSFFNDLDRHDTITGGMGDDTMTGSAGNDTFVFNFVVTEHREEVLTTLQFRNGNTPAHSADAAAWTNYLGQLENWRAGLTALHGTDLSNTQDDSVSLAAPPKKVAHGASSGVKAYDNDFSYVQQVSPVSVTVTGEGHDTIERWGAQRGYGEQYGWGPWSADAKVLKLSGLSDVAGEVNFYGNFVSVDTVADGKTVITIGDSSITLMGVDTTMAELLAGGYVRF